jgi:hypothetical protein
LLQRQKSLPAHVRLGFELHGSTAHRIQHPGRDLATDASFLSRQQVSKKMTASFYELAMNGDRFPEKWVPPIEHLTDFVLGGIVLCCSIAISAIIKGSRTNSLSRRSFSQRWDASNVKNNSAGCSSIIIGRRREVPFSEVGPVFWQYRIEHFAISQCSSFFKQVIL